MKIPIPNTPVVTRRLIFVPNIGHCGAKGYSAEIMKKHYSYEESMIAWRKTAVKALFIMSGMNFNGLIRDDVGWNDREDVGWRIRDDVSRNDLI